MADTLTAFAPAKVNLFLHVGPAKPNGRHDLDSLVVFADASAADVLHVRAADTLSFSASGPSADSSGPAHDNLVLRAAHALRTQAGVAAGADIELVKNLPVAAGIGGGSADAGAALRLLTQLWQLEPHHAEAIAPALGGDVPVALRGTPSLMRGEGERLLPAHVPSLAALLVNPGVACPTGPVFQAFDASGGGANFSELESLPNFADARDFISWLAHQRNDLESPAIERVPKIASLLATLSALPGARLARMSGSGATCFALFETLAEAEQAGHLLRAQYADYWIAPTRLGKGP